MAFILSEPPGFTDIPDALLQAGSPATGFVATALKDNAAFGSVVPEVFYSTLHNGDTVPLPISPVDGYQYLREELIYIWEVQNTVDNAGGTPAGNDGILWGEWFVEPNTGVVHCTEVYGRDVLTNASKTNDGTLAIWSIGIRGRRLRELTTVPAYTDLPSSDFAVDGAASQTNLQNLSHNTKRAGVQCEVFPMNPSNAPVWQPNTFYTAGTLVQPSGEQASGFWFIAANTGTSGPLEPTWPGVWYASTPTNDGSLIWNIAGAGFYHGQQIPFPASDIDGYQYSSVDVVVPFISFVSTQSLPFQKGLKTYITSGNRILKLQKQVVAVQPANPGQNPYRPGPPGKNPLTLKTIWPGNLQNWTPSIAPPALPSLSSTAGGSLPATTYYVKITYTSSNGETTASAEASLAVAANNILVVASPAASGAASGWNVYVSTSSGTETLQSLAPTPIGTSWTESDQGIQAGTASPPATNTTGFSPSPAEGNTSPFLTPGSPTTEFGIVSLEVDYLNGTRASTDGTVMVWLLCFRNIAAMSPPGGALFVDMSTDEFTTGNPLRADLMQNVNENAKFSILRPEIFSNSVAPGAIVPLPVSPVDGYAYSRGELTYLWFYTSTGDTPGHVRDFSLFVDPQSGVVNSKTDWYNLNGGIATTVFGAGGRLVYNNMSGHAGQMSITVVTIARRQHETLLQGPVVVIGGGSTPAPPGPFNLIPNGDFSIWSIPDKSAALYLGTADDWSILQQSGSAGFQQLPGIGASLFAQGLTSKPSGNTLAQRQQTPPPGGNTLGSIGSFIIPVWPGGLYKLHFIAAVDDQFNHTNHEIDYGFYARIHLLAAAADGTPDLTTDTTFELLGPNLTLQPGTTAANNPGGSVTAHPPNNQSFDFTFTIPLSGASSASTSAGQSVLSQTINFNPAYVYIEFLLWDIVDPSGTFNYWRRLSLDDAVLQDLTAGTTNLNHSGFPTGGGDNSAFSFGTTTTTISLWWAAFNLPFNNGVLIAVPAQGSSGSPAKVFSGLTPSTTYYVSARWNLATFAVELRADLTPLTITLITQWSNADGYFPIFGNFQIATPASGTGGGGGSGGGGRCFTGETKIKTVDGFVPFEKLGETVMIENETGQHLADVIVHEESDDWVIPIGTGRVNLVHGIRWAGRWIASGELLKGMKPVRFRGKLYNAKIRSDREEDKHYILEGGWVAHNPKVY